MTTTTNCLATLVITIPLMSSCAHGQSAEASCNLEPKDLPKLLQSIRPLIEKGYGDPEIQAVQRLSESTPVKDTRTRTFPISYRGKNATLRIELKKDDVDEIEIWFITQPQLATEIQKQMKEVIR
jgi:hypothetical protein